MLKRTHVSALTFALLLAGPGAAQGLQAAATHPAESIDIGALTAQSDFTVFMTRGRAGGRAPGRPAQVVDTDRPAPILHGPLPRGRACGAEPGALRQ